MCIRDSLRAGLPGGQFRRAAEFPADAGRRAGAVEPAHRHACLLYTSDAADERSSVDLGGRRILKKKGSVNVARRRAETCNE